jgi:hypothetical protein
MTGNDLRKRISRIIDLLIFIMIFSYFLFLVWVVLGILPDNRYVYFCAGLIFSLFLRIFFLGITEIYKEFKNERL